MHLTIIHQLKGTGCCDREKCGHKVSLKGLVLRERGGREREGKETGWMDGSGNMA